MLRAGSFLQNRQAALGRLDLLVWTGLLTQLGRAGPLWARSPFSFFSVLLISINVLILIKCKTNRRKNPKITNKDFLESLWVDLHSRVMIWHMLVEVFYCFYLTLLIWVFRNKFITKVVILQLLWNFYGSLLML
jgi:hypothetical protein